jgi:hypothetical protein
MRLAWTVAATCIWWVLALAYPKAATLLIPVYCFAVVLPYGFALCERRFARYRHHDDGPHSTA